MIYARQEAGKLDKEPFLDNTHLSMKKFFLSVSALALSLAVVSPVFAQTTTPTATPTKANGREQFRVKLQTIRDEKKKAIVERIDQQIVNLNTIRTTIMLRHLTKIEEILNKVEARTNEVAATGKDVAAVRTAITKARDAIAAARTAVNAQVGKTYTINITTEASLGSAVATARKQFASDLLAAHKTVVAARKSVRDVLVALGKAVGEKLTETSEK